MFSRGSIVSLLLSAYSLGGVLQAASLFRGERAMRNYHFWGTAFLVFLAVAIVLRILAFAGGLVGWVSDPPFYTYYIM